MSGTARKVLQERAGPGEASVFQPFREASVGGVTPVKFPRTARLLKHADFRRVYEQGRRHFSANLTAFYLVHAETTGPRIGFTVSRAMGGAVDRNRMKRRLRDATRGAWNGFSSAVDVVVNPKKTVLKTDFGVLVDEMRKALAVIEKQVAMGNATARPAELASRQRRTRTQAAKSQR